MTKPRRFGRAAIGALLVILVAVAARGLSDSSLFSPLTTLDSSGYVQMAQSVVTGHGFVGDLPGRRTPGYPSFLVLVFLFAGSGQLSAVVVAQILVGLASIVVAYYLTYRMFGRLSVALVAGAFVALDPALAGSEHFILTETLSAFLVLLSLLLFSSLTAHRRVSAAIGLGATLGFLVLVRPVFVALPLLVAFTAWLAPRLTEMPRRTDRLGQVVLLAAVVLPAVWAVRSQAIIGVPFTTQGAYSLTQHAGAVFDQTEFSSAREETLRNIFVAYREQRRAESGSYSSTVYYALDEMSRATGLDQVELASVLFRMSVRAIQQHPLAYLDSAVQAWKLFWQPHLPVMPGFMRTGPFLWVYLKLFSCATTVFLILVVAFLSILSYRHSTPAANNTELTMILSVGVVLYLAVVSSLTELGENARLRLPVQAVMTMWLVWGVAWLVFELRSRNRVTSHSLGSKTVSEAPTLPGLVSEVSALEPTRTSDEPGA
jgi:4-amino-4-deoxy-L-arabinose transferase-like glycosyltransferase